LTNFEKNANMKSVRQGDFYLIDKILKCKVLITIPDEITGREDYMWSDTYIPMDVICYFSLNVNDEGLQNHSQVVITLSTGNDLVCRGSVEDIVSLYNKYLSSENKFKFN
jgi:hypothetical protein